MCEAYIWIYACVFTLFHMFGGVSTRIFLPLQFGSGSGSISSFFFIIFIYAKLRPTKKKYSCHSLNLIKINFISLLPIQFPVCRFLIHYRHFISMMHHKFYFTHSQTEFPDLLLNFEIKLKKKRARKGKRWKRKRRGGWNWGEKKLFDLMILGLIMKSVHVHALCKCAHPLYLFLHWHFEVQSFFYTWTKSTGYTNRKCASSKYLVHHNWQWYKIFTITIYKQFDMGIVGKL